MTRLELDDIQGILLSGYPQLKAARYLLAEVRDAARARAWLGGLEVHAAADGVPSEGHRVHVALAHSGFEKLGLPRHALNGFSREFQEGMWRNERRRRILGDLGESAPEHWHWGGPNHEVDLLVMLYAEDDVTLEPLFERLEGELEGAGLGLVRELPTRTLPDDKEHFGFRDGISQPKLIGLTSSQDATHLVVPGEFVLGYPNGHGQLTARPMVDPIEDPENLLPEDGVEHQKDFGKNGSYLVFRQLTQDVPGFWRYLDQATRTESGSDPDARLRLGAKMVGRWPSGAPLVVASEADRPELAQENAFRYHAEDPDGLACPIGAHVRRTNPRDSLAPDPGTESSLQINRRHRLLRRGRSYGPPVDPSMDPERVLAAGDDGKARGLHFLCFNASISRQFEFVQHTWANSPNFAGLYSDSDPLIGDRERGGAIFTVPACPVRERYHELPRFVGVAGGEYFFLPGLRALRYLTSGPRELTSAYSAPMPPASPLAPTLSLRFLRFLNRRIEGSLHFVRRFTRVRAVMDAIFKPALERLAQGLLVRRRLRRGLDDGLGVAEERPLPGEEEVTQQITRQMTRFLLVNYRDRVAERAGNTKTYGLVRGTFEIAEDLRDDLRIGLYAQPGSYEAWVRFGGPGPLATPDIKNNGVLSLGVKVMGVAGPKLLDDESGTVDFTGISAPTFTTPDAIENLKLQQHIGRGTSVFYFLDPFDSHLLDAMMQGLYAKAHGNPLELSYWSCVPYLFGEGRAIKYRFVPQAKRRTPVPFLPGPDYLREAMVATLAKEEVRFDLEIQLQTDPRRMPIEDASIVWPERLSPPVKVATLRLPVQSFDSPEQLAYARQLTFNPWHTIAEHRPLGNQNRARRAIYYETSRVRQRINDESHAEPTGDETFP